MANFIRSNIRMQNCRVNIKNGVYIIINVLIIKLISFGLSLINFSDNNITPLNFEQFKESKVIFFLLGVIIVPAVETLAFQSFVISVGKKVLSKLGRWTDLTLITLSSLLFGLQHFYSFEYFLNGFFIGIVLAYSYSHILKRGGNAFVITMLIHSLVNLVSFFEEFLF